VLRRCTALGNFPAAAADDMHGDPPGPISQAICGSTDSYVSLPLSGRQVTGAGHRRDVTIRLVARTTTDRRSILQSSCPTPQSSLRRLRKLVCAAGHPSPHAAKQKRGRWPGSESFASLCRPSPLLLSLSSRASAARPGTYAPRPIDGTGRMGPRLRGDNRENAPQTSGCAHTASQHPGKCGGPVSCHHSRSEAPRSYECTVQRNFVRASRSQSTLQCSQHYLAGCCRDVTAVCDWPDYDQSAPPSAHYVHRL